MSTIAINEEAHRRLLYLKENWGAKSLNEVIQRLLEKAQTVPRSLFGVDPDLPDLDRAARDDMWA